jgi:hypothetical protein
MTARDLSPSDHRISNAAFRMLKVSGRGYLGRSASNSRLREALRRGKPLPEAGEGLFAAVSLVQGDRLRDCKPSIRRDMSCPAISSLTATFF